MKLSDAQFVALLWMRRHGNNIIEPWPGGFWTIPGMKPRGREHIPIWHTGTNTVRAMERAGLLKNIEPERAEYKAKRIITEAGLDAFESAEALSYINRIKADPAKWCLAEDLKLEELWMKRSTEAP